MEQKPYSSEQLFCFSKVLVYLLFITLLVFIIYLHWVKTVISQHKTRKTVRDGLNISVHDVETDVCKTTFDNIHLHDVIFYFHPKVI